MHYQVSRNGQMYGPYTLDDLNRYVASGNVLKTDMVKSETMADWIPVSQLLQQQTGNPFSAPAAWDAGSTPNAGQTPMPAATHAADSVQPGPFSSSTSDSQSNSPSDYQSSGFTTPPVVDTAQQQNYTQPQTFTPQQPTFTQPPTYPPQPQFAPQQPGGYGAPVANASQYPDAPNLNWGLYLLLAIVTCTLFSKVFTVVQAVWLHRVQPNSKGLYFYIGLYVLYVVSLFFGAGQVFAALAHPGIAAYTGPGLIRIVLQFAYLILLLVTRFVMSASLEEHFNGPEPVGLQLNPVMVFFFGGVYFQSQFNRINAMKQAARYGSAPRPY